MVKLIKNYKNIIDIAHTNRIQKKCGRETGRIGTFYHGKYHFGAINMKGCEHYGVYQMRNCKEGRLAVKMRFQRTREEEPTPARLANWEKMRQAVEAWQGLSNEQKENWNKKAKGKKLTGYNLYIKTYLLSI